MELGDAFAEFEEDARAAASLAQVLAVVPEGPPDLKPYTAENSLMPCPPAERPRAKGNRLLTQSLVLVQ